MPEAGPLGDLSSLFASDFASAAKLATETSIQDGNGQACWQAFGPFGEIIKAHPSAFSGKLATDIEAQRLEVIAARNLCNNVACRTVFVEAATAVSKLASNLPVSINVNVTPVDLFAKACADIPTIEVVAPTPISTASPRPRPRRRDAQGFGNLRSGRRGLRRAAFIQVDGHICAVISPHGDETLVAIPGTEYLDQWLIDFDTWPWPAPTLGWCHQGFGRYGRLFWTALREKLPQAGRIVFAGHSLGGAVAEVCAVLSAAEKRTPARVVTFGAPRVAAHWNLTYGPLLRSNLSVDRFVNYGDPVPNAPGVVLFGHKSKATLLGDPAKAVPPMTANHAWLLYSAHLKGKGL